MQELGEDEIQGSKFVFYILRLVNYLMMILGVLVIVASVYVYLLLESFTLLDVAIIAIGAFIIAISYFSFYLKDSLTGLTMYIFLALVYLFCQLIACMVIASSPESVVAYIVDRANPSIRDTVISQVQSHVRTLQYIMGLMLVVTVNYSMTFEQVVDVGVAFWYRKTLKEVIDSNPNSVLPYAFICKRLARYILSRQLV
eukprot:TRINITY_DN4001_c0_g1_i1.p1 TRINITY_DN4001_c0_g1~~TRINITY_DN4001_c0_g1_i1.p1  ORF type:complete len:233 (-),score=5.00 TRINITY_DN4001_c0_g1_i1:101-697(-)